MRRKIWSLAMHKVALVVAFLVALAAPAFAQKSRIEAANAKWIESFNKGDFDAIANLYTTDATALPPGSSLVKGRPAIGQMWKGMAEQVGNPRLTILDVKRLGPNAAREIGTYTLTTKGPSPKEISGKYLVVWENVFGGWKISSDIWNEGK